MPEKIYLCGAGIQSALGHGIRENVRTLLNGKISPSLQTIQCGAENITFPFFDIKDPTISSGPSRINTIIDRVLEEAFIKSGLTENQIKHAGLFIGSTSFDIFSTETAIKTHSTESNFITQQIPAFTQISDRIINAFGIQGPVYTFNTACTSAANALSYAADFIRLGKINHAIVLGLEFYNEMTALGFSAMELLAKEKMQPFSKHRDGLCLGEACAAIVLSKSPHASKLSYISSANLIDSFSVTACNPDGSTVAAVIQSALSAAEIHADQIKSVKVHGTATLSNDEAEAAGLIRTFNTVPPLIVIKPFIGHTLGACGLSELVLFTQALLQGSLPIIQGETFNENKLHYYSGNNTNLEGYHLLNCFGFGGNNTATVIHYEK